MTAPQVQLAGKLADLGNGWLTTLGTWGNKGLGVALTVIVVVTMARKFSLKAGVGALIAMVIALGIYNSRDTLAALFSTPEFGNHANALIGSPDADTNYILALYNLLLHRQSSLTDLAGWLHYLPTLGRPGVADRRER